MIADTIPMLLQPAFIDYMENNLVREFASHVEDWGQCVTAISRWEDAELLDNPTEESINLHKTTLENLIRFGKLMLLVTSQPDFPDKRLTEIVEANQQTLQDKMIMWHGTQSKAESKRILQEIFHES